MSRAVRDTQAELRKGLDALALEVPDPVLRDINRRVESFWEAAWAEIDYCEARVRWLEERFRFYVSQLEDVDVEYILRQRP